MIGIDYAWGRPGGATIKAAGYEFVMRYLSHDLSKNLDAAELANLTGHGLAVGVVWEAGGTAMSNGSGQGLIDATAAAGQLRALGMHPDAFVYFAADWDATPQQQPAIDAYLDAATSVLGPGNVGIYGGYWPCKRALDGAHAAKAWQTFAWSGGQWDQRAAIRQGTFVTVGGIQCDADTSMITDYGQWPRWKPPPPPPVPVRRVADGSKTLVQAAAEHHTTVKIIKDVSRAHMNLVNRAKFDAYIIYPGKGHPMPAGLVFWTPQ